MCRFGLLEDEMAEHTNNPWLWAKMLTAPNDMTLAHTIELTFQLESVDKLVSELGVRQQQQQPGQTPLTSTVGMEEHGDTAEEFEVNAVDQRTALRSPACGNCVSPMHHERAQFCPARGQRCKKCGRFNHFAKTLLDIAKTSSHTEFTGFIPPYLQCIVRPRSNQHHPRKALKHRARGCETNQLLFASLKKLFVLLFFLCLPSSFFLQYLDVLHSPSTVVPSSSVAGRNVTVLLWYQPFKKSLHLGEGDVCWDQYGISGCRLEDRHSAFNSADIVVFHNRELVRGQEMLPVHLPRPPGQRWAWMSLEAPKHNGDLSPYGGIFNMTVSYRRDADVTVPYGEIIPVEDEDTGDDTGSAPLNKSSLVCWVVSNYRRIHRRSRFYRELQSVVPVVVYGRWNRRPLPSQKLLPTISTCYFYLSLENTVAKDYITEKLWRNAYAGGAVPVVLGPPMEDYNAVAPPHSFIHVDQFSSVKELGRFLRKLVQDQEEYQKYFSWRRWWRVRLISDWRERLCRICSQFTSLPPYRVYTDLQAWDQNSPR
ncbi:alpha-(1,3)-fucosyltransferase 7-like [Pholidichthys leucotaenia]